MKKIHIDSHDPLAGLTYYLVGGAVRDSLLNLPVRERDYVVVGSTPKALLDRGFMQVGQDFPVFLHPTTKEEYALARTERKSGTGYSGFVCDASATVTLEEDLLRRDLTINAIAQDAEGSLVDPCNGLEDLQSRTLRHVSPAFIEDPLRVLRVARFAAYLAHLEFKLAPETQTLMNALASSGELDHLTQERVWLETEKALASNAPAIYFDILKACGAMSAFFSNFADNSSAQFMPVLRATHGRTMSTLVRYVTAQIDLDAGQDAMQKTRFSLADVMRPPKLYLEIAHLTRKFCDALEQGMLSAETLLAFLHELDSFRRPERWESVCEIIALIAQERGWNTREDIQVFSTAVELFAPLDVHAIIDAGFQHQDIRHELDRRRLQILDAALGAPAVKHNVTE